MLKAMAIVFRHCSSYRGLSPTSEHRLDAIEATWLAPMRKFPSARRVVAQSLWGAVVGVVVSLLR
jgi:hypothetical protein